MLICQYVCHCLSVCLSICTSSSDLVSVSVHFSFCPSLSPSVYVSFYVSMSICLFACLCLSVYWSHYIGRSKRGHWEHGTSRPHFCPFPTVSVVDLRGERGTRPLGVQILSISCSFGEIWQNLMLAPLPRLPPPEGWQQKILQNNSLLPPLGLAPPAHLGNPGSATALSSLSVCVLVLVTNSA